MSPESPSGSTTGNENDIIHTVHIQMHSICSAKRSKLLVDTLLLLIEEADSKYVLFSLFSACDSLLMHFFFDPEILAITHPGKTLT